MNYFDRVSNALTGMYRTSQEGNPFKGIDFTSPTDIAGNPVTKPANDMYSRARRGFPTGDAQTAFSNAQNLFSGGGVTNDTYSAFLNNPANNMRLPQNNIAGTPTVDNFTYPKDVPAYSGGGVGVSDAALTGSATNFAATGGNNFNATSNQYGNFLQDPLNNSLNFNPTQNTGAGNGFSGLFGLTDWMNGGTAQGSTNYMSSGDILGGVGGALSTGMGIYGMFTGLDQGQQQLDDTSRRTDLLESKYNEELRHRGAIREQNKAGY